MYFNSGIKKWRKYHFGQNTKLLKENQISPERHKSSEIITKETKIFKELKWIRKEVLPVEDRAKIRYI